MTFEPGTIWNAATGDPKTDALIEEHVFDAVKSFFADVDADLGDSESDFIRINMDEFGLERSLSLNDLLNGTVSVTAGNLPHPDDLRSYVAWLKEMALALQRRAEDIEKYHATL